MFSNFRFDLVSFLLGLISGLFIWFVVVRYKATYPHIRRLVKTTVKKYQEIISGGAARYVRLVVLRKAQRSHLAAGLFSLDEIVITPRLLVPVFDQEKESVAPGESITPKIVTFFPSWPEMVSQYNWPCLTMEDALQQNANIAIIGQPGSGKTVALAYLAAKFARKEETLGPFTENTPVFFHIHELGNIDKVIDLFDFMVQSMSRQSSLLMKSQISSYLNGQARAGSLIVLLDGLDQLHPELLLKVTKLISAALKRFPGIHFVVSAAPDYLDGLLNIGFHPLTLANWNFQEREDFTRNWGKVWNQHIIPQVKKQLPTYEDDQILLQNWITPEASYMTPFDWTLKVWAAYSGDACGAAPVNQIDAYVYRNSAQIVPPAALSSLALECIRSDNGVISRSRAESILPNVVITSGSVGEKIPTEPDSSASSSQPAASVSKKTEKIGGSGSRIISALITNGILCSTTDDGIAFAHPLFMGYLASLEFDGDLADLIKDYNDPRNDWLLHYLAAQNKAVPVILDYLNHPDPPFYSNLLKVCRWLKDAPLTLDWRGRLMRQIVKILTQPDEPFEIRTILFSSLTVANDPSVSGLFRQLLTSPEYGMRLLAALGCGAIQDNKSVHEVALLVKDPHPDVRLAASMALGVMRSDTSMQYISEILISGEESLKQAVAESLPFRGDTGLELLNQSYHSDDLVLRRAITYGLCFIHEEWARQMLEHIAVEDAQWVVRNSAAQALETFDKPGAPVPAALPPPSEASWLIAFASKQGSGIVPGKIPMDLLIAAVDKGTPEERVASLDYLRMIPNDDVIRIVYRLAFNEEDILRLNALLALWYFKVSGAKLPMS